MASPDLRIRRYGRLPDGRDVDEFTLDNGHGLSLSAINHGGIVTALRVPDRLGRSENVVLGLPTLADYVQRNPHFGTIVGRYANRIAHGRFIVDGVAHQLPLNDGAHSLHGGTRGFGARWWRVQPVPADDAGRVALDLHYTSADGEEGYPGELSVRVRYTLTTDNCWLIDYQASTDRATHVNLSHHDYFNLAGAGAGSVLEHELCIAASRYTPVDAGLIPLGIEPVEGTPFDFRQARTIGERIREGHVQLLRARGYDHNWVLDGGAAGGMGERSTPAMHLAARLREPRSGRVMELHTTECGLQFYSGNFLDGTLLGSSGQAIRQGDGLCLETQHFPDSPNQPGFPSTLLRPGETFRSHTMLRFTVG